MKNHQHQSRAKIKTERGSVLIFVTISFIALLGIAAWSTETGSAWQTKSQLQAAADSAALAGVGNLLSIDFLTVDEAAARAAAMAYGPEHEARGINVAIAAADVEVGSWNMAAQAFTALPGNTNPDVVRAVRAVTRRDSTMNGPIGTILGRALGVASISVNTQAIAYWGFAGGGGPGVVDLPIVIDCCAVSGPACTQNYCDTISSTISNPCLLSNGDTTSCLEFFSTPEQNACWTAYESDSPAVSVSNMTELVQNGNTEEIGYEPIYLDNGTKTPVIQDIKDKFEAEGTDIDGDGFSDTWVVTLSVVECQNPGDQCASGDRSRIVGFLCMDIREIIVTPDKIIKGDFICSTDSRCDTVGFGPGGTLVGGISADYPVIVN
jgi:Flp pilus assembly protein TadG